jgi:AcrR family transcriptional regulator
MPKIVDKVQKRKDIAKSTCSLFIAKGFVNISISQIAKFAGIGKGTIYEYFNNKEDIVFELMSCLQEDYDPKLKENLLNADSSKDRIICLFNLFISDSQIIQIQRKIYQEFLAIYLTNPTDEIKRFYLELKEKYRVILEDILKQVIEKGELSNIAIQFIPSIFATIEGFFISNDNSKQQILDYIDNLFILLENYKQNKGEIEV